MVQPFTAADARNALAVLRMQANRVLDPLFAEVAALIERLILRHARTGPDRIPRLDRTGASLVFAELRSVLAAQRGALVTAIGHAIAAAERLAVEQARRLGLVARAAASDLGALFVRVNGLVASALERVLSQVGRVLTRSVEVGQDARVVVTCLVRYFDPRFSPYRNAAGRLVRANVAGALTDWPAASGMASAPVRLIARHELNAAHGRRTLIIAAANPGTAIRWIVSPVGPRERDECDHNAERDAFGLGPGVYLAGQVPRHPRHAGCQCVLQVVKR